LEPQRFSSVGFPGKPVHPSMWLRWFLEHLQNKLISYLNPTLVFATSVVFALLNYPIPEERGNSYNLTRHSEGILPPAVS